MKPTRQLIRFLACCGSVLCLASCTITTPQGSVTVDSGAALAFAKVIAEK